MYVFIVMCGALKSKKKKGVRCYWFRKVFRSRDFYGTTFLNDHLKIEANTKMLAKYHIVIIVIGIPLIFSRIY